MVIRFTNEPRKETWVQRHKTEEKKKGQATADDGLVKPRSLAAYCRQWLADRLRRCRHPPRGILSTRDRLELRPGVQLQKVDGGEGEK